jgi:hypothetical protein
MVIYKKFNKHLILIIKSYINKYNNFLDNKETHKLTSYEININERIFTCKKLRDKYLLHAEDTEHAIEINADEAYNIKFVLDDYFSDINAQQSDSDILNELREQLDIITLGE